MVEKLHLARTLDYTNKTLKADLNARLNDLKGKLTDKTFTRDIESQIAYTLDSLTTQGIIQNGSGNSKVVDDKLVIDINFMPIFPLNHVTTTITLSADTLLNEEDRLENEEDSKYTLKKILVREALILYV